MYYLVIFAMFLFFGCLRTNKVQVSYNQYLNQSIDERDRDLILYTVRQWGIQRFDRWEIRPDMYRYTYDDVEYFIGAVFYSPNKRKMMAWVGTKEPNALTLEKYGNSPEYSKICPTGNDTVYHMSAIIGYRTDTNKIWSLYPLSNRCVSCSDDANGGIEEMCKYYFKDMKKHSMYQIEQSGENKGTKQLRKYDYNLQDKQFWDSCWIWHKDTVGSFDLYNFQVVGYRHNFTANEYNEYIKSPTAYDNAYPKFNKKNPYPLSKREFLKHSANPYNPPEIDYPKKILELYSKAK